MQIEILVPRALDEMWGKNIPATLVSQHVNFEGEDTEVKSARIDPETGELYVTIEVSDEVARKVSDLPGVYAIDGAE